MTRRGRGEGAVYQRHDHKTCPPAIDGVRPDHRCRGRWVSVVDYGWKGGRRDRRTLYGATKTEVQQKLKELLKAAPRERPSDMPTVGEWLDEWLRDYKPKLKPQTRASHESKIKTYMKPLIGTTRLDRLTTLQVEQIEARITMDCPTPTPEGKCPHRPRHGLSVSTARQTFVILNDALNDAVKAKKISENPARLADAPSTFQEQEPHLVTALADLVIAVAEKEAPLFYARILVALEQGLRPGEALGLCWGLVDLDEGSLTVARTIEQTGQWGTPKSRAGYRTIPLTTRTWDALRRVRAELEANGQEIDPTARIFPQSHDVDRDRWRKLLDRTGVPYVKLKSARQSAARRLEENGVPERVGAQFLGHSNVNMTYRYQRGAPIDVLHKAING